jgi:hypothetical protein
MVWQLIAAGVSAAGQIAAGRAAEQAAKLDAFNIETQKVISEAEALQRHNDRLEQYRYNVKANIASFYASGRDVGSDRSVRAFLERQKEIATEDTRRSDLMGVFESMKLQQQATTTRIEGRARKQAAMIGAFTTMAQGYTDYQDSLSKVIPTGS